MMLLVDIIRRVKHLRKESLEYLNENWTTSVFLSSTYYWPSFSSGIFCIFTLPFFSLLFFSLLFYFVLLSSLSYFVLLYHVLQFSCTVLSVERESIARNITVFVVCFPLQSFSNLSVCQKYLAVLLKHRIFSPPSKDLIDKGLSSWRPYICIFMYCPTFSSLNQAGPTVFVSVFLG